MRVVAIIPARGGSKSIPRKNIKPLAGKPLISYPIMAAKACKSVGRVVVSTEDEEIADVARTYNAEIISRPAELAEDETPTLPVLVHAVRELEKTGYKADVVVLLYATGPFVKASHIEDGLKKIAAGADSVVAVCEDTRNYKLWSAEKKPLFKKRVNRQSVERVYRETGALYIMTYETLMGNAITGKHTEFVFMKPEESIDIDNPLDFAIAEALMKR